MSELVEIDNGRTMFGGRWKVGTEGSVLIVTVDNMGLLLDGDERDRFAEAVARAVTPGQAEAAEAGGVTICWHCRKLIVRCDSVPSRIGCSSGRGWIHSDPEQWGHDCEPRSGAPYARPDAPSS